MFWILITLKFKQGPWLDWIRLSEDQKFFLQKVSSKETFKIHRLRTPRESFFFKNLELMGLGKHFVLKCFEAFGVFSAGLSAPILVLWVPYPCFSLFNLLLIITALVTQWMIDHLAHAQVLEKGESEHSPHLPSVSHWRWDVSQLNIFLHLICICN